MSSEFLQPDLSKGLMKREKISNYNGWIYEEIKPYLGNKILDIGSGVGSIINYFIKDAEILVGTDIFEKQVQLMQERFKNYNNVSIDLFILNNSETDKYKKLGLNTITCINVLEHIEDDRLALETMKDILVKNGRIILLVPAYRNLYGTLDKACGHFRRYDKGDLQKLADSLDLRIIENKHMNFMGIIPWYIKGKVLKKKMTFSESLNGSNKNIYNFAAPLLMAVEKKIRPHIGISEIIVLEKIK